MRKSGNLPVKNEKLSRNEDAGCIKEELGVIQEKKVIYSLGKILDCLPATSAMTEARLFLYKSI